MSVVKELIRDKARGLAGNPPIEDVSDFLIDTFIDSSLARINEAVPAWKPFYVTTVVDQHDYSIDSTVVNVLYVDWRGDSTFSEEWGEEFSAFDAMVAGNSLYDVETGIYKKIKDALVLQQLENNFSWDFREHDRKIWLIPPPSTAGRRVYYIGTIAWTYANVPPRFEEYMTWYAVAETMNASARKRRRMSAVSHTGTAYPWSNADPQLADAERLMTRFNEAMMLEGRKAVF